MLVSPRCPPKDFYAPACYLLLVAGAGAGALLLKDVAHPGT